MQRESIPGWGAAALRPTRPRMARVVWDRVNCILTFTLFVTSKVIWKNSLIVVERDGEEN